MIVDEHGRAHYPAGTPGSRGGEYAPTGASWLGAIADRLPDPDTAAAPSSQTWERQVLDRVTRQKKKPAREIMAESNAEAEKSLADAFDGWYGGLKVRIVSAAAGVDDDGIRAVSDDRGVGPAAGGLDFTATIEDAAGKKVGKVRRIVSVDENGDLFAEHVRLEINEDVQGQGFAEEFNAALEDWYRESGVTRIELEADIDVGGYAWARQGYDFRDGVVPEDVVKWITRAAHGPSREDYFIADYTDSAFRDDARFGTYGVFEEYADEPFAVFRSYDEAERAMDEHLAGRAGSPEATALLARVEAGERISAYEISQYGRQPGQHGRDAMWIGKQIMLGSDWYGVRWLT